MACMKHDGAPLSPEHHTNMLTPLTVVIPGLKCVAAVAPLLVNRVEQLRWQLVSSPIEGILH